MKIFTYPQVLILGCTLAWSVNGFAQNYFAGISAGSGNTGILNVFVGPYSGSSANTGNSNSFYGSYSGRYNKGGNSNTFIGTTAGQANVSGDLNTFAGSGSGGLNTTGGGNSYFGYAAGYANATGGGNAMFGREAGYHNKASNNSFFGSLAGRGNTTASGNTFVGYTSGRVNTTGGLNTFVGSTSGYTNSTGDNNTMIGFSSGYRNATGKRNTFLGAYAGFNTTGNENSFVGQQAGIKNTTGSGNTALGYLAGPHTGTLTNSTAIGNKALVTTSNSLVLGSVAGVNGAGTTVKVGIGTYAPGYLLHVNGVAAKPGGGSWTVASDKRLKQEIKPYKEGLSQIMKVEPIWYRYNGKAGLPTDRPYVGIIAQDMQKIAPHTIGEFTYQDSTGQKEIYLDYDANALMYMLVNAVKEQELKSEQQLERIAQLEKELVEMKNLLNKHKSPGDAMVARLLQNYPNPYNTSTIIGYYVPENVTSAAITIYSASGGQVRTIELTERGQGEIEISNETLSEGVYIYHLEIDGTSVDDKKMIVLR